MTNRTDAQLMRLAMAILGCTGVGALLAAFFTDLGLVAIGVWVVVAYLVLTGLAAIQDR